MRYVISVIDDTTGSATDDEIAAIDTFNDALVANGHWVFAGGLAAPHTASVIDGRAGGQPAISDGPLVEGEECLSGCWIVEVPDHATAVALAADGSRCCNRRVELRAFLG